MNAENEAGLTPRFLRMHLKAMAEVELSEQTMAQFGIFAGLVAMMNVLEPEGYSDAVPAFGFNALKE